MLLQQHLQGMLNERQSRGCFEVGLILLIQRMRRVIGSDHIDAILLNRTDQFPAIAGFLREGYYADLVVVDLKQTLAVTRESLRYLCGWSPLEGQTLNSGVTATLVNGKVVFRNGECLPEPQGRPLTFALK